MTLPKPKILAIDDTPVNLMTLGAVLAKDFDLQFAESGPQGIELARQDPPDLILLDIMMPEVDGFETCQRLKADPALRDIPVVFVTALNESVSEEKGLSLGAADYITKPINIRIARQRIHNLIDQERWRKQLAVQHSLLESKIQQLKQSELALQSSDILKKAILNALRDEIAVVDRDGVILAVNEPWQRFARDNPRETGEPIAHIQAGSNYFSVFEAAAVRDIPEVSAAYQGIRAVMAGTLPRFSIEYPCHSLTEQRWFLMSVTPLGHGTGGVVIAHTNITARIMAQTQVIASENRLRTVIENEPECVKIVDQQGLLQDMNAAGLAMIEADRLEQVAGLPVLEVIAPEHRAAFARMHQRVLAGESVRMEFEVIGLKGGRRWLETHATPMQDHGETVQLAVTRDISARKQAEEKLQLAASVFKHSREGITISARNGTIIDVNHAFCQITGYSRDDVLGQNTRSFITLDRDASFYATAWHQLIKSGYWSGELKSRRKTGEVYDEMLTVSVVRDRWGKVLRYVTMFSDISERKRMEEQVRQLAFHDTLTQLPNRRLLSDRLRQAIASSKRSACFGALLFLDLDNFKPLNDLHGHSVGDLLLIEVARRLTACVREIDTVARFGGDEFVLLLGELSPDKAESAARAGAIAEKVRAVLAEPYRLTVGSAKDACAVVEHRCTASIGVELFLDPEATPDDIVRRADAAMYQAKGAGANLIRFHETQINP